MKRTLPLLLALVCVMGEVFASPVTPATARRIASAFLSAKGSALPAEAAPAFKAPRAPQSTDAYYYVFNAAAAGGFVVVSGDDRTPQVLAWADRGSLDAATMPAEVKAFLQGYADELKQLDTLDETEAEAVLRARRLEQARHAVAPLLRSQWNQYAPYNNLCPTYEGTQTVTGCVATALAQVLYYYKQPATLPAEIPAYSQTLNSTTWNYDAVAAGTAIDWASMTDTYGSTYSEASDTAVAELMSYCGRSVKMSYAPASYGGSGASQGAIAPALKQYFGYRAQYIDRADYTLDAFEETLYGEVAGDRPVIFCGQSTGGGHCFVIDGYDGDGRFHVNWGWGGASDGYFLVSVLNPYNTSGAGASTTNDGFSMLQSAVVGIEPGTTTADEAPLALTVSDIVVNQEKLSVQGTFTNFTGENKYFDMGLVQLDAEGNVVGDVSYTTTPDLMKDGWMYSGVTFYLTGFSLMKNRTFRLALASRETGTTAWQPARSTTINVSVDADGNVTVSSASDPANLSVTAWKLTTTGAYGYNQTVEITLANAGAEYYGTLYLFATAADGSTTETCHSRTGLSVRGESTTTVEMNFKPTTVGTWNLKLAADAAGTKVIGQTTMDITSTGTIAKHILQVEETRFRNESADKTKVFGRKLEGTYRVKNTGTKAYVGTLKTYILYGDYTLDYTQHSVSIDAGKTVEVSFATPELMSTGFTLGVRLDYGDNTTLSDAQQRTLTAGAIAYAADGTTQAEADYNDLTLTTQTTYVDLTSLGAASGAPWFEADDVNPNALFLFSQEGTLATSLRTAGWNVVVDGEAQTLSLRDGYDFYTPQDVHAAEATYTRKPRLGTGGTGGWETLCLPFAAQSVAAPSGTIDWFHSGADAGRDFWLMDFKGIEGTTVVFDYVAGTTIPAHTPLIIAVPDATWGEEYSLVGKDLTFSATDVTLTATDDAKPYSRTSIYDYIGTSITATTTATTTYLLNTSGTAFQRQTASAEVKPFRAWFQTNVATAPALSIGIAGQGTATGLNTLTIPGATGATYDLSGRRASGNTRGIVIREGKKYLVK